MTKKKRRKARIQAARNRRDVGVAKPSQLAASAWSPVTVRVQGLTSLGDALLGALGKD
jgi:hypothetical protein